MTNQDFEIILASRLEAAKASYAIWNNDSSLVRIKLLEELIVEYKKVEGVE
jgi:hypothetical protein